MAQQKKTAKKTAKKKTAKKTAKKASAKKASGFTMDESEKAKAIVKMASASVKDAGAIQRIVDFHETAQIIDLFIEDFQKAKALLAENVKGIIAESENGKKGADIIRLVRDAHMEIACLIDHASLKKTQGSGSEKFKTPSSLLLANSDKGKGLLVAVQDALGTDLSAKADARIAIVRRLADEMKARMAEKGIKGIDDINR